MECLALKLILESGCACKWDALVDLLPVCVEPDLGHAGREPCVVRAHEVCGVDRRVVALEVRKRYVEVDLLPHTIRFGFEGWSMCALVKILGGSRGRA